MSMSLLVANFKDIKGKLDADYSDVSIRVNVNKFIDDYIDRESISDFKVYDDEDEYIYKEVQVNILFEKLNSTTVSETYQCKNIEGMKRLEAIKINAQDLVMFNHLYLLCSTYYKAIADGKNNVKLIIT